MRRSAGSIWTSTSSASGSTSTPAALVWIRPCDSVAGTRCTRCTPPSYLSLRQTPESAPAADRDGDVLVAAEVGLLGVEDLGLPALPLGVAQVHPQQVAGEQRRLLAALAGLDLQDHVLAVVGVARQQQLAQLVLQRALPGGQLGRLGGERRSPRRPARGRWPGRPGWPRAGARPPRSGTAPRTGGRAGGPAPGRRARTGRRACAPARRARRAGRAGSPGWSSSVS